MDKKENKDPAKIIRLPTEKMIVMSCFQSLCYFLFVFMALFFNGVRVSAQFSDPQTSSIAPHQDAYTPEIAVSDVMNVGTVYHMAYYTRFSDNHVYYLRSTDAGASWTLGNNSLSLDGLDTDDGGGTFIVRDFDIDIAAHGELVYVVWATGNTDASTSPRIYFSMSSDGGVTFTPGAEVPNQGSTGNFRRLPRIDVDDSGNVHLVWGHDAAPDEIRYSQGTLDQGTGQVTWSAAREIDDFHFRPNIHISNDGFIYIACQQPEVGNNTNDQLIRIFRRAITADPVTIGWTNFGTIPGDDVMFGQIANDSEGRLYVAYENGSSTDSRIPGQNDIFVARSDIDMNGVAVATWTPVGIATATATGYMPDIAVTSTDEVQVVWLEPNADSLTIFNNGGNIRLSRSLDKGLTWQAVETLTKATAPTARNISFSANYGGAQPLLGVPNIIFDSGQTTVAWVNQGGSPENSIVLATELQAGLLTVDLNPSNGFFIPAGGSVSINVMVSIGGVAADNQDIEFEVITSDTDGGGNFSGSNIISVTTANGGMATATYTGGADSAIVDIRVRNTTTTAIPERMVLIQQELVNDFENPLGLAVNGNETGQFGNDIGDFSVVAEPDSSFASQGNVLQLQSDTTFDSGFVIFGEFTFSQAIDASDFTAIEYKVRSDGDDPGQNSAENFTAFIQLIMPDGSFWQQLDETTVASTAYQTVRIPLQEGTGFQLAEGSASGTFDPGNISGIRYFLNRNQNSSGGQHAVYFDDVRFRTFDSATITRLDISIVSPFGVDDPMTATIIENTTDVEEVFGESTFFLKISALDGSLNPIDFQALEVSADISISTTRGQLIRVNGGTENTQNTGILMLNNPTLISAYLTRIPGENDVDITVMQTDATSIQGTTRVTVLDGESALGEFQQLARCQDEGINPDRTVHPNTGMVAGFPNSGQASTFSNALAVIAFVHQAVVQGDALNSTASTGLERARNILSAFEKAQIPITDTELLAKDTRTSPGENNGGFFDFHNIDGTPPQDDIGDIVTVTTGNNAWMMMALNYYTLFTGDTQFESMAQDLITFLSGRQIVDNADSNFGGLYNRDPAPAANSGSFITEHQGESYSAFRFYAEILAEGLLQFNGSSDPAPFETRSTDVKSFLDNILKIPDSKADNLNRFVVASSVIHNGADLTLDNVSADAQTSPFFALQPDDNESAIDFFFAIDRDNDSISDMIQTEIFEDRNITGPLFKINGDHVWIEGAAQLALALELISNAPGATLNDVTNADLVSSNLQKLQNGFDDVIVFQNNKKNSSGGYPTFLDSEIDPDDGNIEVGNSEPDVVVAAWRYFAQVHPPVNPYNASAVLTVSQSSLVESSEAAQQVELVAKITRNGPVSGTLVQFSLPSGFTNGSLSASSCTTQANGECSVMYNVGNPTVNSDIAQITVEVANTGIRSQEITILQDLIDDFDHSAKAAGDLLGFGNVLGQFSLEENEGRNGVGDTAAFLTTGTSGFQETVAPGCVGGVDPTIKNSFIGFTKSVDSQIELVSGNPVRFDASAFNAITYWVKNQTDNTNSPVTVSVVLVIGDGGDETPCDLSDTFTGSTWKQKFPLALSSVTNPPGNVFEQVIAQLDNFHFQRTVAPTNDGSTEQIDLESLRNDISAVTIVMDSRGETGTQRGVYVDDIGFFNNDTVLRVTQEKIFTPSDPDFNSGTEPPVTLRVTARITDRNNNPVMDAIVLKCTTIRTDGSEMSETKTLSGGEAPFDYIVTNESEIVEIRVEEN